MPQEPNTSRFPGPDSTEAKMHLQRVGLIGAKVERLVAVLHIQAQVADAARQQVQPLQQLRAAGRVHRRVR